MRVGFIYNVRREDAGEDDAEFDDPKTIKAIGDAIAANGHEVIGLEADRTLPTALTAADVDVVFNMAEGRGQRSREAQVPALLELLCIPYTGSDAVTLGITLDKSLASSLVSARGVATPRGFVMRSTDDAVAPDFPFPAIVKPVHEGSSKGISNESIVFDEAGLRERAGLIASRYAQPVVCEEYIAGREITVGLLGSPARVLPPMEVVFLEGGELPLYSFEAKRRFEELVRYDVPAPLTPEELSAIEHASRTAFEALGCRDVARIDFRLDGEGTPYFLECNPLPGLGPGVGDLTIIAEGAGLSFEELIGEILAGALERLG